MDEMSKETLYKTTVFLPSIRNCKKQAQLRFAGHGQLVEKFACITPQFLKTVDLVALNLSAKALVSQYSDLTDDFVGQLRDFRNDFTEQLEKCSSPRELLGIILNKQLGTLYPEVVTGLVLFLTIPVTVATAERSFSKLKLIKNYLRSTMCQSRLSALALISIENVIAKQLDIKKLTKIFAVAKPKRAVRFNC